MRTAPAVLDGELAGAQLARESMPALRGTPFSSGQVRNIQGQLAALGGKEQKPRK